MRLNQQRYDNHRYEGLAAGVDHVIHVVLAFDGVPVYDGVVLQGTARRANGRTSSGQVAQRSWFRI